MEGSDIKNEELDEVGRKLFGTLKLQDNQIEEFVTSPHLFRSVMTRIEERDSSLITVERRSAWQWNWRLSLAAYGMLAVLISGAIVFSIYEGKSPSPPAVKVTVHDQPDLIVRPFDGLPGASVGVDPVVNTKLGTQHVVLKTRSKLRERRGRPPIEEVSEFYPLSGGVYGNEDGGQLVRVDLPRSALTAMGVDVPFESNGPKVKTDLLIGSDGVMRAVRFVK